VIAALTVTGPPGSGLVDADLTPCWLGGIYPTDPYFWCPDLLQNAVSGFYTFRVEDADGDYLVSTDYLEAAPQLAVPVHIYPVDGTPNVPVHVTLDWDPVDLAEGYRVDMRYSTDGGTTWLGLPNQFPANPTDTQVTVDLDLARNTFGACGPAGSMSTAKWTPSPAVIGPGLKPLPPVDAVRAVKAG